MKHISLILILAAIVLPMMAQSQWQVATAANVTMSYRTTADNQHLEFSLSAPTTGWVAVGFAPVNVMQGANFIIGYINSSGTVFSRDDWGNSQTSHTSDMGLGGTNNILSHSGAESSGLTAVTFLIPLNSGDQYDKVLVPGSTYTVLLARGANGADNFTGMHAEAGMTTISVLAVTASNDNTLPASSGLRILPNHPNPFNPSTTITWRQDSKQPAQVSVFDVRGRKVFSQTVSAPKSGENSLVWNAFDQNDKPLAAGRYIVRITSGKQTESRSITLSK